METGNNLRYLFAVGLLIIPIISVSPIHRPAKFSYFIDLNELGNKKDFENFVHFHNNTIHTINMPIN